MEPLKFVLLGAPQIWLGDQPLPHFVHKKTIALLIYLATTQRMHTRDALANLFWPETDNSRARKNLRDILPELHRAVGTHILITPQTITLNSINQVALDVTLFQSSLKDIGPHTSLETLQTAVDLYKGEFLEGFHLHNAPLFEEWVTQQREQLHELAVAALDILAKRQFARQAYTEGLLVTQRLLALDPWREQAYHQRIRFLAAIGSKQAALAQYKTYQTLWANEFGIEPSAETTALYEQIRNNNKEETASVASFSAPAPVSPLLVSPSPHPPTPFHNLPRQFTPLIGRQMEITTLRNKLIAPDNPLLTLVGAGGIGKTRLAIAVGAAVLPHFRDGVWFVSLAGVRPGAGSEARLVAAIGKALKLNFSGTEPLASQLFARLRTKQLLLLLDNFEQLVDSAEFILDLLRAVQGAKALVTSRQRLNLQAEVLFELDGLSVPEESATRVLEQTQLLDYESVALFVERASRNHPSFRLTAEDPRAILRICRQVAGSPLGIELAATLVNQRTCGQIANALHQSYAILATTQRDLPPRQRSIQATLAYSWQFLSSAEARVLALCAVFYGSFSLAAAQAVIGAGPDMLTRLVAQSLLHETEPGRYALHELVRQYAAVQLQQMPAVEQAARHQHCDYFTIFLANQAERARGVDGAQPRLRPELDADLDNIRAAWQWAIDHTTLSALKKSREGLYQFYYLGGFYQEGEALFQQAATCVEKWLTSIVPTTIDPPTIDLSTIIDCQRLLAELRLAQSSFCNALAQLDEASRLARAVIAVGQSLPDLPLELKGYQRLGEAAFSRGDYATVRDCAEKALVLARAAGLAEVEAISLSALGMYFSRYGESERALALYHEALLIAQRIQDRAQEGLILNNLGICYDRDGDFGQAFNYFGQTLSLYRQLGDQSKIGLTLFNLGHLLVTLGQYAQAQSYFDHAAQIFQETEEPYFIGLLLMARGRFAYCSRNFENARQFCEQAVQIANAHNLQGLLGRALIYLGHALTELQCLAEAATIYNQALSVLQRRGRDNLALVPQTGLAYIALLQHDLPAAQAHIEAILPKLDAFVLDTGLESAFIFVTCYRVLAITQDARANKVLQQGYQLLQTQAETLDDETLRRSFLENVPINRELLALAQAAASANLR